MDRRQRKTRDAIFTALIALLSKKEFAKITVGEIIDRADIGRATFYSHFETKDDLIKALCEELFCHIFDAANNEHHAHQHIFDCEPPESVFLHLLRHLQKNDNHILDLLSSQNNDLFLRHFKQSLQTLIEHQLPLFAFKKSEQLPEDFWMNHITSTFVDTVQWWIKTGMRETPETIHAYFFMAV